MLKKIQMSQLCGKVNKIYARIFICGLLRMNKYNSSVLDEELLLGIVFHPKRHPDILAFSDLIN